MDPLRTAWAAAGLWMLRYAGAATPSVAYSHMNEVRHSHRQHAPEDIAAGRNGALWFIESIQHKVGRIGSGIELPLRVPFPAGCLAVLRP